MLASSLPTRHCAHAIRYVEFLRRVCPASVVLVSAVDDVKVDLPHTSPLAYPILDHVPPLLALELALCTEEVVPEAEPEVEEDGAAEPEAEAGAEGENGEPEPEPEPSGPAVRPSQPRIVMSSAQYLALGCF